MLSSAANCSSDHQRNLRHACDRCHSAKLRCLRSLFQDRMRQNECCLRCRKAGVVCITSARGKAGRPRKGFKKNQPYASEPVFDSSVSSNASNIDTNETRSQDGPTGLPLDYLLHLETDLERSAACFRQEQTPRFSNARLESVVATPDMISRHQFYESYDSHVGAFGIPSPDSPTIAGELDDESCPFPTMHKMMLLESAHAEEILPRNYSKDRTSDSIHGEADVSAEGFLSSKTSTPRPDMTALENLSNLNIRILTSLQIPGIEANRPQLLKNATRFSEELIMAMQGILSQSTAVSSLEAPLSDDWTGSATSLKSQGSPSAATTFLLLGCYTQILHLYEAVTDCIWVECYGLGLGNATKRAETNFTWSLDASIDIHRITCLIRRLQKAFVIERPEGMGDGSEERRKSDMQTWHKPFIGLNDLGDGLLGQAFKEITERETQLLRRVYELQEQTNR